MNIENFEATAREIAALLSAPRCRYCSQDSNAQLAAAVDAANLRPSASSLAALKRAIVADRADNAHYWRAA